MQRLYGSSIKNDNSVSLNFNSGITNLNLFRNKNRKSKSFNIKSITFKINHHVKNHHHNRILYMESNIWIKCKRIYGIEKKDVAKFDFERDSKINI